VRGRKGAAGGGRKLRTGAGTYVLSYKRGLDRAEKKGDDFYMAKRGAARPTRERVGLELVY